MGAIIFLQARSSSSRLPFKVLLPIGGSPIVILAAKRASNLDKRIKVITTTDEVDDPLVRELILSKIDYFRGDLNNVLKRFVDAAADLDNDELVFRITADNVFPDGQLIQQVEEEFIARGLSYITTSDPLSGLPYGVSVELTRVGFLREALREAIDPFDLEHVTPYIIRKYGKNVFKKYASIGAENLRATIDYPEDYSTIRKVFSGIGHPETVSFLELIEVLAQIEGSKKADIQVYSKFVLGTAQLGLNYGINNISGQPNLLVASDIIKLATLTGIRNFDTAANYGSSESILGLALSNYWKNEITIITKLSKIDIRVSDAEIAPTVKYAVASTINKLAVKKIDVLLFHEASDIDAHGGVIFAEVINQIHLGFISKVGVSIQTVDELEAAINNPLISHIQMPFNILDYRWKDCIQKIIKEKLSGRSLTIHVRSIFLQGLLLSGSINAWKRVGIEDPIEVISWLNDMVKRFDRISVAALCMNYVNSMKWIDGVVIGVETLLQLQENLQLFLSEPLSEGQIQQIEVARPIINADSLNPSNWNY